MQVVGLHVMVVAAEFAVVLAAVQQKKYVCQQMDLPY
jgi:hypothetical protein